MVPFAWPGSCGDKDTKRSLACLPAWVVPSPSGRVGEHWGRVTSFLGSLGSSACTFVIAGWLLNIGSASGFGVWGGSSHVCSAPLQEGLLGTRGHRGRQLASLPPGTVIVGCPGADQVPGGAGGAGGAPGTGGSSTGIYTLELEKGEDVHGAAVYELGYNSGDWSLGVLLSSALTQGPLLPPQSRGHILGILGWSHRGDSWLRGSWADGGLARGMGAEPSLHPHPEGTVPSAQLGGGWGSWVGADGSCGSGRG